MAKIFWQAVGDLPSLFDIHERVALLMTRRVWSTLGGTELKSSGTELELG